MTTFSLILHVTAAVVLVGPQLLMFFAVVPSTWFINDEETRRNVTKTIARRFGMMAGIAILVLLTTGLYQFYSSVPGAITENMMEYRWGLVFTIKMTTFTLLVALIFIHAFVFSRRIARLSDAVLEGHGDEEELERARTTSFMFSLLILVTSVVTLWLGVMMGDHTFSFTPR